MKKYFSLLAITTLTATLGLTSCDDSDDGPELIIDPVETSDGVFVINSGNKSGGIDGSLTYYEYATGKLTQNVYQAANEASLGTTPNHAVVYGSKIYIVGNGEQTIFVADRKTLKNVAMIKVNVNGEAAQPREAVAGNGHVYVSTYQNAVIAIDTLTNEIDNTFESGNYSEGMAIDGKYLYVADSNYGKGFTETSKPSISGIDLTKSRRPIFYEDEQIANPVDVKIVNGRIFILDSGSYDANWNQTGAGVYELIHGVVTKRADATEMAVSNNKIFMINAPYTTPVTTPTYTVFDMESNTTTTFCNGDEIEYPAKISVDPVKGNVFITSYHIGSNGYADYKGAGYCVIYDETGAVKRKFDCGVGAGRVIPNTGVEYVQK